MFGLDDDNFDDIQQPLPSGDFIMVLDVEKSSGSQHSTSKPKQTKKKKIAVSRKQFLGLQAKVDQILVAVSPQAPQNTECPAPQSLTEHIEVLEIREMMNAQRILLKIAMGIRDLNNRRTTYHKEFLSIAENIIKEVTKLKYDFKKTLERQASHSKQLVE